MNFNKDKPMVQPASKPLSLRHRDAEYLWSLRDYKERVSILYPEISPQLLQNCSIFSVDALVIGYFLEGFDQKLAVYEIGSFVGVSSYLFATHSKVSNLVCIDPNPRIADEAVANSEWAKRLDLVSLDDLRVFDVARKTFASLDAKALESVEFREGVVGSAILGARTERKWQSGRIEIPQVGDSGNNLLAYVDGLHTKEGVREDLKAIFKRNPNAITILDDCRHTWGAWVQAGAVDFLDQHEFGSEYTFRLFADLSPGVATSNLGLLYHRDRAQEVNAALRSVASKFNQKLDPVQLLIRENELIAEVNRTVSNATSLQQTLKQCQQSNERLQQSNERLQQNNEVLLKTLQRRSHRAAEALVTSAQKIPGVRNLLIRKE